MNDPEAALRRLRDLANSYPERLATAAAAAAERGRREVTGTSSDESVTVSAVGDGTITDVAFSATALRRLDSMTLGERATEAINKALDAAESQRPGTAEDSVESALDEALDTLNYRLDGVLGELDRIERSLEP